MLFVPFRYNDKHCIYLQFYFLVFNLLQYCLCSMFQFVFFFLYQWHPTPDFLAWKIPWMEEPGRLQSMGSPRVRHD